MKKFSFITVLLIFLFSDVSAQQKDAWYKTYSGKMGNMDAVLHLTYSKTFNGYLWFKQNQYPVSITGEMKKDSIILGSMDGLLSFEIRGKMIANSFTGSVVIGITNSDKPGKKATFDLKTDSSFTPFKVFTVNTTAHLLPKIKNESTFSYDKTTIWPAQGGTYPEGIKNAIRNFFKIPKDRDVKTWLFQDAEKQKTSWQRENNKLSPKEASEMGLSLSVETQEQINVMYENNKSITLALFNYAFTGGAHGNYATSLINISKTTGKPIKLTDVISSDGVKKLPILLDQVARLQFNAGKGTLKDNGFFVDQIPVSKEYYITSTGIGFLYSPYELKSFAEGEINLFVPFKNLERFLNPSYRQ